MNIQIENSKSEIETLETSREKKETEEISQEECRPVKSVEELENVLSTPPSWLSQIKIREKRSETVIQNVLSDCHTKCKDFKRRPRLDARFTPKTLVCHDYKGGYLEDRHLVDEVNKGNQYTFYNWSHIDIFVYFSHHFITVPPLCWINAAHREGVKILGTIITEFDEGTKICKQIFKDTETVQAFIAKLSKITEMFKLDGWLLNIENPLDDTTLLKEFIEGLTSELHKKDVETLVIWYDSVIEEGKLSWQNELNEKNACFFNRCDGIFLNYVWTEEKLLNSIEMARERYMDVYVGIDIFGRNTFGGGQFNSYKAAEAIRRHGLSMAIFAPGWTHESIVPDDNGPVCLMEHFFNKDSAFWNSLWPYLYTYPITRYFSTSFYRGADTNKFSLLLQQTQLSKVVHPKYSYLVPNYTEIPTLERKCHCIRLEYEMDTPICLVTKQGLGNESLLHNLFVCDIKAEGVLVVFIKKKSKPAGVLGLRLVSCLENGSRHVVILKGKRQDSLLKNTSLNEVNPIFEDTSFVRLFKKRHAVEEGISEISVYVFEIERCHILEIGAVLEEGEGVCLEAFGIEPRSYIEEF